MPTRRPTKRAAAAPDVPQRDAQIIDVSVVDEMESSFLAYAMSVITARALPDARDGLKPVQRRILYSLWSQRILPSGPYKKSARIVGDTMARYHPHGDGSIYLSLCNLATSFSIRVPLVDPHGNFGSLDDSPAASRYTECRLAAAGLELLEGIDEDTVDFSPNYDGTEQEPAVLPAAFPNLLVNGTMGVAVGMTTSIPPHNLAEVTAAAKLLLADKRTALESVLNVLPAPDFPAGGEIVDLDEVHAAYRSGKGSFKVRARASIVDVGPRRRGIEVTELPYMVGPEKVVDRVRQLIAEKRLNGIASVVDLTDRSSKLRLVFEVRSGFDPAAVLAELYRLTPMEETFSVSLVALIDGRPKVCSLIELLEAYLDHRVGVVRRRTEHRRSRALARLHLVEGLLIALDAIDEVIATIRSSRDTASAKSSLMKTFSLSDEQASYILEMPLRRLTSLEVRKLRDEAKELRATIKSLSTLLRSDKRLAGVVAEELDVVAAAYGTPRRSSLTSSWDLVAAPASLEIVDEPVTVGWSTANECSRLAPPSGTFRPNRHDRFVQLLETTAQATVCVVADDGSLHPVAVHELPTTAPGEAGCPAETLVSSGVPVSLVPTGVPVLLATARGVIKRTVVEVHKAATSYITLAPGDRVVAATVAVDEDDVCLVTRAGQLLRIAAATVRPQGRAAAGVAGIRLDVDDEVLACVSTRADAGMDVVVVTDAGGVKVTPVDEFPRKGRGTAGVRAVRLRSDEQAVTLAAIGSGLSIATGTAAITSLPERVRRDASAVRPDRRPSAVCYVRPTQ